MQSDADHQFYHFPLFQMMWAADFDEEFVCELDQNCLEALTIDLSTPNMIPSDTIIRKPKHKRMSLYKNGENSRSMTISGIMTNGAKNPLCGLSRATRNFWISKHEHEVGPTGKAGDDELAVFCVAAILITNRHKIMRETKSIDDVIKAGVSVLVVIFVCLPLKYLKLQNILYLNQEKQFSPVTSLIGVV